MPVPQLPLELVKLAQELGKRGQAAFVIYAQANIDDALEYILSSRFTNFNPKLRERIFDNNGPLSSFSAKVDLAHALNLIDVAAMQDLHTLRRIRNAFAHPKGEVHFGADTIQKLLRKFSDYDAKMDPYAYFAQKANSLTTALNNPIQLAALIDALSKPRDQTS